MATLEAELAPTSNSKAGMGRRLAFISPVLPDTTGNGLAMRMGVFLEALARIGPVDLILVPVAGGAVEANELIASLDVRVHVVTIARRNDMEFQLLARVQDANRQLAAFRAYGRPTLASYLSA